MDNERKETRQCCRHRGSSWISSLKHLTLSLIIVGTQLWSVSLVKAGDPENIYAADGPFSAKCLARWRAGITDRDPCIRYLTVGGDPSRRDRPGYVFDPNPTAHGQIWVFETTCNGKRAERAIVYHDCDPNQGKRPHWHAAKPGDGSFKWGSGVYRQCGGDHHIWEGSRPEPITPRPPSRWLRGPLLGLLLMSGAPAQAGAIERPSDIPITGQMVPRCDFEKPSTIGAPAQPPNVPPRYTRPLLEPCIRGPLPKPPAARPQGSWSPVGPVVPALGPLGEKACDTLGLDPGVGAVVGISGAALATLYEAYVTSGAAATGISFSQWLYTTGYYAAGTTGGTALIVGGAAATGLGAGGAIDYCTGNRISGSAATGMLAAWDTAAVIWRWRFDYTMTQNAAEDCYRGSSQFLLWGR